MSRYTTFAPGTRLPENITFNRSKVIKLYGGEDILGGWVDMLQIADNLNLLREGEPMSFFYGYKKDYMQL